MLLTTVADRSFAMKSHNDQSMTKTAPGPGVQETVPGVAASAQLDRAAIWVLVSLSLAALLSSLGTSIAHVQDL